MPAKAPAPAVTLAEHMHRADADLVDAADVPAQMMEAGRVRFREGDHVMIAAVDAVQEGDAVARMVGKAKSEDAGVEVDRSPHVPGEHQDVREPARKGAIDVAPEGRAPRAGPDRRQRERALIARRGFWRDRDLDEIAVVVAEPEPVRVDAGRRIEPLDPHLLQAVREPVDVVLECAERHVLMLLARPLADRAPGMRIAERTNREPLAIRRDREAELGIEALGGREIGRDEMKMIERMNAELSRPALRLDVSVNSGHRFSSRFGSPAYRLRLSRLRRASPPRRPVLRD